MSTPPAGYPRAAAVSPRVQVRERTGSTNADLAAAVAADPAGWPHLSVLLTEDQTAGRGRLDRSWTTPPGSALAVSVLARVPDVPIPHRGWIPLVAGAAMTRAIANQLPRRAVGLKWPNDVLVGTDGRKICGILAEVVSSDADAVVIGSGVNTHMAAVDLPVPTAISFAVLGVQCDADALLADYLSVLRAHLDALASQDAAVRAEVAELCLTLGRDVAVSLPDGQTLRGRAERLDDDGRLVVASDAGESAVSAGDIVHVRA